MTDTRTWRRVPGTGLEVGVKERESLEWGQYYATIKLPNGFDKRILSYISILPAQGFMARVMGYHPDPKMREVH